MAKKRNQAYRRHQRNRVIAKKVKIFTQFWGNDLLQFRNGDYVPLVVGKWAKGKVHCSCKLCKYEKHYNIPKEKDKATKRFLQQAIDEVLADGD